MRLPARRLICSSALILPLLLVLAAAPTESRRAKAARLLNAHNYKEAYELYAGLVRNTDNAGAALADDLSKTVSCLQRINRIAEVDDHIDEAVKLHAKDWRLLHRAAHVTYHGTHYGHILAGEFKRGHHRGGGRYVNVQEQDRQKALVLMNRALAASSGEEKAYDLAVFVEAFAGMVLGHRGHRGSWRLQYATDLKTLPDYTDTASYGHSSASGAPVDEKGNPVYHGLPKRFADAETDGERWRWLLHRAAELDPDREPRLRLSFADFLRNQFGVNTVSGYAGLFGPAEEGKTRRLSISDLGEEETIAKLATGVKRLTMPGEFNFIRIYEELAASPSPLPDSPIKNLAYRYYEGDWDALPDFGKQPVKKSGKVPGGFLDLDVAARRDYFGLVFEGELEVPQTGVYRFELDSDDGASLSVGETFTLPYDGLHGAGSPRRAEATLKKGTHRIRVAMFEKTGDEALVVKWSGPGIPEQFLSAHRGFDPVEQAHRRLAETFENRRQYPKAADIWRRNIKRFGVGKNAWKQKRLEQLVGSWGRFEGVQTFPAGKAPELEYRFRNGKSVTFTAHRIAVGKLLDDVKAYLKKRPRDIDWKRVNIGNIGHRLVTQNEEQYIGEQVAEWKLPLEPPDGHLDRREAVTPPLKNAGAYLLTARMADGNTSKIVVWITDTVIVKQPMDKKTWCFVADAVTGKPLPKTKLEFFGYRQEWKSNKRSTLVEQFAELSDNDGQVFLTQKELPRNYQWIITATDKGGRLAFLGFTHVWYGTYHDQAYKQRRVFGVTDRPVYRPNQPVNFKVWVRHAQYDQEDTSQFAGQNFVLTLSNPKGEKVLEKTFTADKYGGFDSQWAIPDDATLGTYRFGLRLPGKGSNRGLPSPGTFRVEEYKKPEFEVKVEAPDKPVKLGERIKAKIKADYYFGAPVTDATVKYKILRYSHNTVWYPVAPWDWFYGRGYWWFCEDYSWYPGWGSWGCPRPSPWWVHGRGTPPEVVAEREVRIGKDGTVEVEIDTGLAAELHGDMDHRYEVTAEVRDKSRRTIVGKGSVLVTRDPFKVHAWVDRGHYRAGDTVRASFSARTPDGKPVKGTGDLKLLRVTWKDDEPVETAVEEWELAPDADGRAEKQFIAARAGQYRLAYEVTDEAGHTIQGGYLFHVRGEGFDGRGYRFHHLELLPDKKEYAPGEVVSLAINQNREDGTIVLFARPSNGVYLPPVIMRPRDKAAGHEIVVTKKDMPNFFVEAFTISEGRLHRVTREIVVPPEKRVLNVDVKPSETVYKPGQEAKVKVSVTNFDGEPFRGSTVLAVYDRSVDYISGGSNIPEIRQHFWKWRRRHNPKAEMSFSRWSHNLLLPETTGMGNIGAFGHLAGGESPIPRGQSRAQMWLGGRESNTRSYYAGARMLKTASFSNGLVMDPAMPASGALAFDEFAAMPTGGVEMAKKSGKGRGGVAAPSQAAPEPVIRKEFADTAYWAAALDTDENGIAEVTFKMPENLTGWRIKAWSMGHGTKVGEGSAEVVTKKELLVRLQAPRFFVERDQVVLSANIHNDHDEAKEVRAVLEVNAMLKPIGKAERLVEVPAHGETRVDWRVSVLREGEAVVTMKAIGVDDSDAMQQRFPVYVHGMLKMDSFCGVLRPDAESARVTFEVPAERRIDQSVLEIRYSPTLAGAMVDALPYLASYPYGCTEQTLNRFLPTVITQRTLKDMGVDLAAMREKRTNLNAQEIGDDRERAKRWKHWKHEPVFDEAELGKMVKAGVKRLTSMQNPDGGWGWFTGGKGRSWPHTTAVVVRGLGVAAENGVGIALSVLDQGRAWLQRYEKHQVQRIVNHRDKVDTNDRKPYADNLDAYVYAVLADAGKDNAEMREFLYRDRQRLAVYSRALIGLAYHKLGHNTKRDMVLRNIDQLLVEDEENETAWLNLGAGGRWCWWYWYGSEYETHAYYLKLLAAVEPKSRKASRVVKYLLNNRQNGTYWKSTRDTALCIEAMADYLRASGESKPDMTVELWLDGRKVKEERITAENLFAFDNKLVLRGDGVKSGKHTVEVRRRGKGPVYFNAYLTSFTLEDFIERAGLEIKVNRKVYRLHREDASTKVAGSRGQAVDQKVEKWRREELKNQAELKSGELVEVELEIESKNDYEYIMFEDMKAAGFEPVDVRSGYVREGLGAYREMRDERVTFFVRRLARGKHSIAYRTRAEIPGRFSALPTKASAMYAPELKANSDEIKLVIVD
jgi:alpha-2-macroglobulin